MLYLFFLPFFQSNAFEIIFLCAYFPIFQSQTYHNHIIMQPILETGREFSLSTAGGLEPPT